MVARGLFAGNCYPYGLYDNTTCLAHPPAPTRYRFLNSGTFMGRADVLLEMLHALSNNAGGSVRFHVALHVCIQRTSTYVGGDLGCV